MENTMRVIMKKVSIFIGIVIFATASTSFAEDNPCHNLKKEKCRSLMIQDSKNKTVHACRWVSGLSTLSVKPFSSKPYESYCERKNKH